VKKHFVVSIVVSTTLVLALAGLLYYLLSPRGPESSDPEIQALIKKVRDGKKDEQEDALHALADKGPEAADAVPALIDTLRARDEDLRLNAALALGKIGQPAVPPLTKLLQRGNDDQRYYAVWSLGLIGPAASDAIPDVLKALSDKNDNVRRKATFALSKIAPPTGDTLSALIQACQDSNADVRQEATQALVRFSKDAAPALTKVVQDPNNPARVQAIQALGQIGPDAYEAVPALGELLGSQAPDSLQAAAAGTLSQIGEAALPVLEQALTSDQASSRRHAVNALGRIGGSKTVDILVEALLKNKNPDVRQDAARSLGALGVQDKRILLNLVEALKDGDAKVRVQAITSLTFLGPAAKDAVPALEGLHNDPDADVKRSAREALAYIKGSR
jgi:HEAT repeat protein